MYAQNPDRSPLKESVTDTSKNSARKKVIAQTGTTVSPSKLSKIPAVSLQQYLKGQAPGINIQEPSGEPGTVQNMFIRGISALCYLRLM
ncbi:hypothetical protein CPT03_12205 [Pedobacter ginsengisoli]|uniref:TonB-dependent receptor plug domain-containing protein n=1 Tax=Pedobacter ginsengisoli TaxID=363852 RepID=A0A2D1U6E2_9SPHI|nr:hypothetical protein CPT03_12205 [Pedobacter ginsengisoli]